MRGKAGLVYGKSALPLALCFGCLHFALRVVLLLCNQFPSFGASLSLADVCKHLVVFCRQHALHQLKTGNTADDQNYTQHMTLYRGDQWRWWGGGHLKKEWHNKVDMWNNFIFSPDVYSKTISQLCHYSGFVQLLDSSTFKVLIPKMSRLSKPFSLQLNCY